MYFPERFFPPPRTARLAAVCREYGISALYAFGSRAKEAADWLENNIQDMAASTSDLDLGALPDPGTQPPIRRVVDLTNDLEDLFGTQRVDLAILPQAPPFLASSVVQGERLYAADEDQTDEYDLYVLRRAGDLLFLRRERAYLLEENQA